jgi:hypothetical protein
MISSRLGAREVEDDLLLLVGIEFEVDGGEGAEKETAGVGHDGGAAGGDLVAGEELVEFGEGAVDGDSRSEVVGVRQP